MSALQALSLTQQALNTTQNQVSTGLAVSKAADNASYWSISQQLNASSGMVTAANSAMTQSQAILDTSNTAINSIITTINQIQSALTSAANPTQTSNYNTLNTTLAQYGQELTDAVNGAYFNGINILDGTQQANSNTSVSFVSGVYAVNGTQGSTFSAAYTGQPVPSGVTTISMTLSALYDASSGSASAYSQSSNTGSILFATGTDTGGTYDLTQLGSGSQVVSASNVQDMLTAVNAALSNVTSYASTIGATQDRMSAMSNLNNALVSNYANGVSGLVDADMNTASTRLQALQTQQQLGIQALSIANQNAQLIMKLFG
jgi:flagellin